MSIRVKNLTKRYRTKVKEEGLKASLHALWHPQYHDVSAVSGIDFVVESGERIAFIGPNGAGKSTTIKMLTGILHPTSGEISVLGLDPARERQKLAMEIGSVFGQRSQLWMHLPPLDSFSLLARIYEIEERAYRHRLAELSELFGLQELMKTPVRKLSLGQRIRCEIAASLLHRPKVIFLDEPTIGLDVVVKQTIRELISRLSREEGTTIFLTSHDAGDVEQVCNRALVIDRGKIVVDSEVVMLKQRYLSRKVIEISYNYLPEITARDGVTTEVLSPNRLRLTVDTRSCAVGELLQSLVAKGAISDVTISDPPMEEIIATIFAQKESVYHESP